MIMAMLVVYREIAIIIPIIVLFPKGITMTHPLRQHMAYVACPLTNIPEEELAPLRKLYLKIGGVLEKAGYIAYIPHVFGDPLLVAHLKPRQIDRIDRTAVGQSSLLVIYAGRAASGWGQELEMAYVQTKPVIMIFEDHIRVSRLSLGNRMIVKKIRYKTEKEGLKELAKAIKKLQKSQPDWLPDILKL